MEEKKLDVNSIIGFGLIFVILIWVMYNSQQKEAAAQVKKAQQEQVEAKANPTPTKVVSNTEHETQKPVSDSVQVAQLKSSLGSFAYSATLPSAKAAFTTIENELVRLKIANKGGYIVEAEIKQFDQFTKDSGKKVQLIKDGNANFNIELKTNDNRTLNTKDLFFEPVLTKEGANQVLTLRLKAGNTQYLEYRYVLKPNEYMLDFAIRSQGLNTVLNTSNPLNLDWSIKTYRNEKSVSYENRYTELIFEYEGGKDDYLGQGESKSDDPVDVTYIAFKQHFFTSVLMTDTAFEKAIVVSENLVKDEEKDTLFTKQFKATVPLAFKNGEVNYNMNWYYGPADYHILNAYDKNLDEIVPLGWGIYLRLIF